MLTGLFGRSISLINPQMLRNISYRPGEFHLVIILSFTLRQFRKKRSEDLIKLKGVDFITVCALKKFNETQLDYVQCFVNSFVILLLHRHLVLVLF